MSYGLLTAYIVTSSKIDSKDYVSLLQFSKEYTIIKYLIINIYRVISMLK